MLFDNMFIQNDVLGSAMQASVVRNDIINNNIANNDVPGFKKKTVDFEQYLRKELDSHKRLVDIRFDNIKPTIRMENNNYSYRIDGNNVDIEAEMVDLYQNSVKYDTLASGVINNYKRINLALTGIK